MSDITCKFSIYRIRKSPPENGLIIGERVADFKIFEDALTYGKEFLRGEFTDFVIVDRSEAP